MNQRRVPDNREVEHRKMELTYRLAMFQAKTERMRAETEGYEAVTRRLCIGGRFLVLISGLLLGYVTDARTITQNWLISWADDSIPSVLANTTQTQVEPSDVQADQAKSTETAD